MEAALRRVQRGRETVAAAGRVEIQEREPERNLAAGRELADIAKGGSS